MGAFDDLIPAQQKQPIPRVIQGPPREPSPQTKTQAELDAEQLEAARLENERRRREAASGADDPKVVDSERTSAFLTTRLSQSAAEIAAATARSPSATQSTIGREAVRTIVGDTAANYLTPADRQIIEGAQLNVLDAALTLGTGAAYTKEQLEGYAKSYFPQLGDTPEAIAAKKERLRGVIAAARIKAGAAAPQIDEALRSLGLSGPSEIDPNEPPPLEINIVGGQPYPGKPGYGFKEGLANVGAGIAQGLVAIPDAVGSAFRAVDSVMFDSLASGAEAVGLDWFARSGRHLAEGARTTPTMGEKIEEYLPTPDAPGASVARFGGSLLGGALSLPRRAATAAVDALVGRPPPRPVPSALPRTNIAEDAKRLEIPLLPADVAGPATRTATAGVAQTLGGASPIVRAANASKDAARAALRKIAGRATDDSAEAGEAATSGALAYRAASRSEAGRLYDRAARLAGDTLVQPRTAMQTLEQHIAELEQVPGGSTGLRVLQDLRDQITKQFPNGITIEGIRAMRTQLRDRFFSEGLRGSDIERRINQVVDAAGKDVTASLGLAGKEGAAEAYRVADAAWAARLSTLDDVIMPIIGRKGEKSGEQVFQAIEQASRSNGVKFTRFMQALPDEEAAVARAAVINGLGRARAGAQNAAGDAFSFNEFVTNWSKLSEKAKDALFQGEARQSIEALARVAEGAKAASRYSNSSNTAGSVGVMAAGAGVFGGLPALLTVMGAQNVSGRILASPLVARALAKLGGARNPGDARAAIQSLSVAATRNPAMADEIAQLQTRLTDALGSSPATAAAAEEQE